MNLNFALRLIIINQRLLATLVYKRLQVNTPNETQDPPLCYFQPPALHPDLLQDVVHKVVPNLMEDEARREKEFITQGKAELVNLCVETDFNFDFDDNDDDDHKNVIRKILATKLFKEPDEYEDEGINILSMGEKDKNDYDSHEIYNDDDAEKDEVTVGDSQIKFVYTAKWRSGEQPLKLDLN